MFVGVQETLTEVIVGEEPPPPVLLLPPPQPANKDERTAIKASPADGLKVLLRFHIPTNVAKAASIHHVQRSDPQGLQLHRDGTSAPEPIGADCA
jgi:hypothetical protein